MEQFASQHCHETCLLDCPMFDGLYSNWQCLVIDIITISVPCVIAIVKVKSIF